MANLLIIEDEAVIRGALRRLLEREGHRIEEAESLEQALKLNLMDFQLILCDLRLPGAPGTALLQEAPLPPVIIMTSYGSVASAVQAIKSGAVDYITKPFDHDDLLVTVTRVLEEHAPKDPPRSEDALAEPVGGMIGRCSAMRALFARLEKIAPTDATVLVLGESGTGKELVARALHDKSRQSAGPFVVVNCAAIPEDLIESELFGREPGAMHNDSQGRTGLIESAESGTLFLDEVGELPPAAQARLLRFLQSGEIRRVGSENPRYPKVRTVAATHQDIRQLVQDGQFRSDLYFRLRVVELNLPPLRERGDDLEQLAEFLLNQACQRLNQAKLKFSREALSVMRGYHWPGNVRELENAIERAAILCEGDTITPDLLAIEPAEAIPTNPAAEQSLSLENYFRSFVLANQDQMTETELAQKLGISRKALWERRQRLGIPRAKKKNG